MNSERIILGIDPGTNIMGYGLIIIKNNNAELITLDVIKLDKLHDHPIKLKTIFETILSIIDKYNPDEMALEAPFFGKNVQSMLKLGRAQGVAMASALYRSIPIYEYSPKKVKQSITGSGNASKEQVSAILHSMFKIPDNTKYLDATDALAVAMCHFHQSGKIVGDKKYSGWETFVSNNPDRVKK